MRNEFKVQMISFKIWNDMDILLACKLHYSN
jgi:hypothetical protein